MENSENLPMLEKDDCYNDAREQELRQYTHKFIYTVLVSIYALDIYRKRESDI